MAAGVHLGLDFLLGTGVYFRHQICETKKAFQRRDGAGATARPRESITAETSTHSLLT